MDEIMKMANFKHPNVMQLLGLTTMDDKLHIVLPFMENGDLKTYISSNKKVNFPLVNRFAVFGKLTRPSSIAIRAFSEQEGTLFGGLSEKKA